MTYDRAADERPPVPMGAPDKTEEALGDAFSAAFDGEPPVEIPVPSGRVLLRGSADKVDLGADGTIYVTDVKTGGFSRYEAIESDPVAGGTKLQLPVYAYAARARLGSSPHRSRRRTGSSGAAGSGSRCR